MRTTVDIDEDVLSAARSWAEFNRVSLGKALSQMARRGLLPVDTVGSDANELAFPIFACGPRDPIVSAERVRDLLEEW